MKRIKMTVAYDGTGYCGWQLQPNGVTIEEILNGTLSELLKEPVCVIGASRTDSGVHALGNVAVFDTESRIPGEKLCYAVNQKLPEDIRVLESEEVPLDWHPRKQNSVKTYEYKILNCRISVPTRRCTPISVITAWMWKRCAREPHIFWESMISPASVPPAIRRRRRFGLFMIFRWTGERMISSPSG